MKQSIFNTRQRAEEIIKEAVTIWQHGFNSEQLEGIEQDPVFSLFLTALAYQVHVADCYAKHIARLDGDIFG